MFTKNGSLPCCAIARACVERTRLLMDIHIQDALVEGYEYRVRSLALPDAADRHILAAAIHGGANVIVTMNLRDFPDYAVAGFGVEAMHPDKFVLELLNNHQSEVVAALCRLRKSFKNPPHSAADLLANMQRHGLTVSADALGTFVDAL
jgi:hypothetical protein